MRSTSLILTAFALCLAGGLSSGQDAVKKKKARKDRAAPAAAKPPVLELNSAVGLTPDAPTRAPEIGLRMSF